MKHLLCVLNTTLWKQNRIGFECRESQIYVRVKVHQEESWCMSLSVSVWELLCVGKNGRQETPWPLDKQDHKYFPMVMSELWGNGEGLHNISPPTQYSYGKVDLLNKKRDLWKLGKIYGMYEGSFEIWDPGDFLKTKKRTIYLELFGLRLPPTIGLGGGIQTSLGILSALSL